MRWFWQKEERAEETGEDPLLTALLGGGSVNREIALQVPTVAGGIDLIANMVASTPIKLYQEQPGVKAKEVTDDSRLKLLNDEPGDTLNANEFWKAMVRDYYLGKGGYAYISRQNGVIEGLYYVREQDISLIKGSDPIKKEFSIQVAGHTYVPFEFFKILRNTQDGAEGCPITKENAKLIETAYASLVYERNMARRGGNKKGFLKSEKALDKESLHALRYAFSRMYSADSEGSDNFVLLNKGIDFKESSNTSAELQLNENKQTNAAEFAKLFHVSTGCMAGTAGEKEVASLARLAAVPLMRTIECALNRDLLLEKEKGHYYFAFDTKELLRGDMQSRFAAYKTALDANFMQIDEVRYAEDMEPLGLQWIRLGLQDVLYDPRTHEIFTPNTGTRQILGESEPEALPQELEDDILEQRGRYYKRDEKGRFAGGGGGSKKGGVSASFQTSPRGANAFKVRGFRNKQALNNHWQNGRTHSSEYEADGIRTKSAYEAKALALCESAVGGDILGHADKNGFVIRYDRKTNDFAKGHPLKGVLTMFKPEQGETYYKRQRKEDLEHGGKA